MFYSEVGEQAAGEVEAWLRGFALNKQMAAPQH